jgi:hypothetical protein
MTRTQSIVLKSNKNKLKIWPFFDILYGTWKIKIEPQLLKHCTDPFFIWIIDWQWSGSKIFFTNRTFYRRNIILKIIALGPWPEKKPAWIFGFTTSRHQGAKSAHLVLGNDALNFHYTPYTYYYKCHSLTIVALHERADENYGSISRRKIVQIVAITCKLCVQMDVEASAKWLNKEFVCAEDDRVWNCSVSMCILTSVCI